MNLGNEKVLFILGFVKHLMQTSSQSS